MKTYLAQVEIGKEFKAPFSETKDVGGFVSIILANAQILAGVLLLIFIIAAGYAIIFGAGQDDPQKAAAGKKAATAALVGFLIIFGAYWIIQLIEVLTGVSILGQ